MSAELLNVEALRDLINRLAQEAVAVQLEAQRGAAPQATAAAPEPALTVEDFAARYEIAPSTQRKFRNEGRLKFVRVGRRPYYLREHVAAFFESYKKYGRG